MLIEKEETETTPEGTCIIKQTMFPKYLDKEGTQELVAQLKAYAEAELGGN